MWKKFFQQLKMKRLARQLRKPDGKAGTRTGQLMNRSNSFMYAFTLELMKLREGETILEIGFGNGLFFDKITAQAPGLSLYGIDYSPQMVKEAGITNERLINQGSLKLVSGNSDALPWPEHFFDKIYCINVIYFWEEPLRHLQEIKRVLKPGGRFYATCRSKDNMAQLPFTAFNFTTYNPEEWTDQLKKAGLNPVEITTAEEPAILLQGVSFAAQHWCVTAEK